MGTALTIIGAVLALLVLGALLVVAGAMAQYRYYGKPELDEVRYSRDVERARADAAVRSVTQLGIEKSELERVRRSLMAEHDRVLAELVAIRPQHAALRHYVESGQHALDVPDPRYPDAVSAEVIDTRDPFYKQLGPVPSFDMSITGSLHIPRELLDAATMPSESVSS